MKEHMQERECRNEKEKEKLKKQGIKKKGNIEEMGRMKENEGKHRRMAMKEITKKYF